MDATTLEDFLKQQHACKEGRDWQRGKHLEEVWNTCGQGDWLLWLVDRAVNRHKLAPLQRTLVLVAVELSESVLHLVPADEERPRAALTLVRQWLAGEDVSLGQLREMVDAAFWAARAAAKAAVEAAVCAAYWTAAWEAGAARAEEKSAAYCATAAYFAAARAKIAAPELHAKHADIVRKHLPYEIIAPLFHN